jgi:AcrR family transcriptional regulator
MPESTSRAERKRARNREALIAAARRLFAERGFAQTTIAEIAEAADLGFGTFYRYFPDKEAVLEAVFDDVQGELDAALEPHQAEVGAADALQGLTARFARTVRRNRDVLGLMWHAATGRIGNRRPLQFERELQEKSLPALLASAITRIIERGTASGEFAVADPALTSSLLAGAHFYFLTPASRDTNEIAAIEALQLFEVRGLASGAGYSQAGRQEG